LKILILTKHFSPEINPRSFRSTELARKLSETDDITVLSPCAYEDSPADRFKHIQITSPVSQSITKLSQLPSNRKKMLAQILHFILPGGLDFLYFRKVLRVRSQLEKKYDAIISIGLPFGIHVASFVLFRFFKLSDQIIFDYGDPFSENPNSHYSPLNRIMERFILKSARAVVVPVEKAVRAFRGLVSSEKIHIIPQGVDFAQYKTLPYKPNNPPRIMYAGVFYERIRDPEQFMQTILRLEDDFELHFYTNETQPANSELLEKYRGFDSKKRLKIFPLVSRAKCIELMSTYDFLINFENVSDSQNPSKLIDYTLSGRPILKVLSSDCPLDEFLAFLRGDYRHSAILRNIQDYDISATAASFKKLLGNPS
jgi:hypothetical protein